MKELKVKIKHRVNEADVWYEINPKLGAGEIGLESDTGLFKYGDGRRTWRELDYAYGSGLTSILCESEAELLNSYPAESYPGAIAIVPQTYTTEEDGTFVMDTPYISLRKGNRWLWTVFSDQKDKPVVSSALGAFILGASTLG